MVPPNAEIKEMDRPALQSWFSALSPPDKVTALLVVMHEFTIVIRGLSIYGENCEARWRLAYHLSEINHALTSAACDMMEDKPTYPADVLVEIILDQTDYPELQWQCHHALEQAVKLVKPRNLGS